MRYLIRITQSEMIEKLPIPWRMGVTNGLWVEFLEHPMNFSLLATQACKTETAELQAKQLHGQSGTVVMLKDFLGKAVEPPPAPSISNAIKSLTEIGALEPVTENLTTLGKSLASMPLSPKLGKMLLYGILFGVLDPLLTIASSISYRSPIVSSFSDAFAASFL